MSGRDFYTDSRRKTPLPLNREQRRALEKSGAKPDEFIHLPTWMNEENKDKVVTRKELLAILVHYHKKQRPLSRFRFWLITRRPVFWFMKTLLGLRIERAGEVAGPKVVE